MKKEGLQTPERKSRKLNMDTEISIKDLKGMEIDENKLEEESNFLLNYDNDLIIAQLSESLVNKREVENIENNIDGDYFEGMNLENIKIDNKKIMNPLFNNSCNIFNLENIYEDNFIDVNKSIKMNDRKSSLNKVSNEVKISTNNLKDFNSRNFNKNKQKIENINKNLHNSNYKNLTNVNLNGTVKKDLNKFENKNSQNNSKNKNTFNNKSLNSSMISNNSLTKNASKLNYSTIKKSEIIKIEYNSNSNVSSNNCSREKNNKNKFSKIFSESFKKKYPNKFDNLINKNAKLYSNNKNLNQSPLQNNRTFNNNTSINNSNYSEKLKLHFNISLINEKIAQLREYQRSLKEKIHDGEIQKNKILKNKNEEISYMKKHVNDKVKVLKNLKLINEKNQKIIEKSEDTINNLKLELRNKSTEIRTMQSNLFNNNDSKSSNINNASNGTNIFLKSNLFSGWNKFAKNENNNCCNGTHSKNFCCF